MSLRTSQLLTVQSEIIIGLSVVLQGIAETSSDEEIRTVAEKALEAADRRDSYRDRMAKVRAAKHPSHVTEPVTATVTGDGAPDLIINGASAGTSATVNSGDTLAV